MSRPAAAARRASTHAGHAAPRPLRPVPPRRSSGPVRRGRAGSSSATPAGGFLVGAAGLARTLPDSRALDRLIRGRAWVAVIAVALIGIVAMQVHMLGLNAGIGRAVEKTSTLEQDNAALRLEVSRLSSGERIASEAERLGLVMPNAGEVRYARVHATDASRGARVMRAPDPDLAAQAKAAVQAGVGTGASALAPESAEKAPGETPTPVTADPTAVADPAAAQPQPQPQTQTQAPAAATETQAPAQQAPAEQTASQAPTTQEPAAPAEDQQQQAAAPQESQPAAATPAGGAVAAPGG